MATTNWLIKHGAQITITDLKSEEQLRSSLRRIRGKTKLSLSGHDWRDIENNDVIVFNPDVSVKNPFVKYAKKLGKQIENEATIFYKLCSKPIIAVTGTRGKTTTANWTNYFLNSKMKTIVAGNSYVEPLLKTLDKLADYAMVVNEIPSYHLEYFDRKIKSPQAAVITNIFQDHLNRHGSFKEYALAKAKIFQNQTSHQNLILNYDNDWTPKFLKLKPKSRVWFFSLRVLPSNYNGIFVKGGLAYFQTGGKSKKAFDIKGFTAQWGEHNLQNLLASSIASYLAGVGWQAIADRIKTLPQVPFRQETIFENKQLAIINDTSATSPDGGIAAIKRFGSPSTILITGGTDRQLDFIRWARITSRLIKPQNIVMLEGSATDKMLKKMRRKAGKTVVLDTLAKCIKTAFAKASKYHRSVILFSPSAKSFEKFKNEFDRGKQFNSLVKKLIKGGIA